MTKLTFASHLLEDQSEVIGFHFEGPLDFYTIGKFENQLKLFLDRGFKKFLCDFSEADEPDTTLWDLLCACLRQIHQNADLKLAVKASNFGDRLAELKSAGRLIQTYPTPETALAAFEKMLTAQVHHFRVQLLQNSGGPTVGNPFSVRVEACDVHDRLLTGYKGLAHLIVDKGMISPALARPFQQGIWEGQAILTSAGEIRVRAREGNAIGETWVAVGEKGELATFPIKVACPGCGATNIAGKNDIFRCMTCNEIYYVDKYGHVISLKTGKPRDNGIIKHLEFTIPSDVNYLNHVRNFIVGISTEERIDDDKIAQIEMSLDEALANVIEHAYAYDATQEIQIFVTLYMDRLEIILRDHGRSFDSKNLPLPDLKKHIEERKVGGLGRYLIKTLMDEVEYQSDSYTNVLKMVKYY